MEVIEKWYANGCDYVQGILIYKNLPKHNRTLLKNLERKENSFNLQKLKYELNKFKVSAEQAVFVAEIKKAIITPITPITKKNQKNENKNNVLFHQLPEVLRPVLLEANALFKENCLLKVSLNELPEHAEKEALAIQKKIYINIQNNSQCWKRIDYFLKHRVVAEVPKTEFESMNPVALYRRQQLLYASVSKLKKRIEANKEKLKIIDNTKLKSQIERQILKQEENLIQQNEKLTQISNLIDV